MSGKEIVFTTINITTLYMYIVIDRMQGQSPPPPSPVLGGYHVTCSQYLRQLFISKRDSAVRRELLPPAHYH